MTNHPAAPLSDEEILSILDDIVVAESKPLPGIAKQQWVIANQICCRRHSPPPDWIWLLIHILEKVIPAIIDYLKHKYGDSWPEKTAAAIKAKLLPWHKPNVPQQKTTAPQA